MNNNRITRQFHALFGIFMVVFYLGVGTFLILYSDKFLIDKALLRIMGGVFILMGLYRIYSTYRKIKEAFFQDEEDDE
jgi:succinate-acetate transporter protein